MLRSLTSVGGAAHGYHSRSGQSRSFGIGRHID